MCLQQELDSALIGCIGRRQARHLPGDAQLDPADRPEIVEDPAQPLDRCTLETSMGTAMIGLEVQLKEIEQGLMDVLAARPGAGNPAAGNLSVSDADVANKGVANKGAAS